MYYLTRTLFSSTSPQIYDQYKCKWVKVIVFRQSAMESNAFLFEPIKPKINHNQFGQAQVTYTYVQISSLVSMARKDQKQWIKSVFLISQF